MIKLDSVFPPSRRLLGFLAVGGLGLFLGATGIGRSFLGLRGDNEEHGYVSLESDGAFELRTYTPAIVARTVVSPGTKNPQNVAFRRIAGYIFGKNKGKISVAMTVPVVQEPESTPIAMTVPVTSESSEAGTRMHFVMPKKWTLHTLPVPLDPEVELAEIPAQSFAVMRFSGVAYISDLQKRLPPLEEWMLARGIQATGAARMAFYDPPWTLPFVRRNEVLVPIQVSQS